MEVAYLAVRTKILDYFQILLRDAYLCLAISKHLQELVVNAEWVALLVPTILSVKAAYSVTNCSITLAKTAAL